MKFIPIDKAKIEFNAPVFTKDKDGVFGLGRLMEKKHTAGGIVYSFEMASFDYHKTEPDYSTDILFIAKPH